MTEKKDTFRKLKFTIAEIWKQDWDEVAEASEGVRSSLFRSIGRTTESLRTASSWETTPEGVAWLALWSRNWMLATSAVGALDCKSPFMLELLWRSAFELNLQLSAIIDPEASGIFPKNQYSYEQIEAMKERLRAFLAWALINDKRYIGSLLRKDSLNVIYDTSKEYDEEVEQRYEGVMEALWGDSTRPVVGREAVKERKNAREGLLNRRNRIVNMLDDSRLEHWRNIIEKDRPRTFFALLSKFDSSIGNRLQTIGMGVAKSIYERPSNLLHGSTVEGFIHIFDGELVPNAGISREEAEQEAANVRRYCHNNGFALELIAKLLDAVIPT